MQEQQHLDVAQDEQQLDVDVVRIATVRARQDNNEFHFEGLDPSGVGVLGEIPASNGALIFAIATSMFATGKPVYYSFKKNAISTDATFGATPSKQPDYAQKGAITVDSIDGIWPLSGTSGQLVLTLVTGPVVPVDVSEPNAFIGWLHMLKAGKVSFDGETIATEKPQEW